MELPATPNLIPTTDDDSNSAAGTSIRSTDFPAAASSSAASFLDLDDEAAFMEAEQEFIGGEQPDCEITGQGVAPSRAAKSFHSIPRAETLAPVPHATRETATAMAEAEALAGICREYDRLLAEGAHSLRTAAAILGKSPSWFSGENSPYQKFKRHGVAGLMPKAREGEARVLVVPAWFVPAARFFYLLANRCTNGGSVPEAVRRTISLPNLPFGWTRSHRERFLKAIGSDGGTAPVCPAELREAILARQAAGRPLVTERLAKQIAVNRSTIEHFRSPREWSLNNQSAPGSQRRYTNDQGERVIMQPGDWFGGDDATPGIAVCVPCSEVITPVSEKFQVLLGRFQWLAYHDARTDKLLAWDYVVRPRGSYRAEDILNGMGAVVRTHGIPNQGWQFEGGAWNSKLVRQTIKLLGCHHWRTYSPHQKAIEAIFNKVWTRLAVQFPHADMGRFRNENEANCKLYEVCKAGHKDPRRYFPTLEIVVRVFEEEVAAHNMRLIKSTQYGQWVPDQLFASVTATRPLRQYSREIEWMFSPFAAERTVKGMLVSCRVPMFENFSVPFDFGADWLPQYHGQRVRLHFNPREPKCAAKVVLVKTDKVLGDAQLIGETAGHIRYILNWGDDDQRAGYLQRQRVGNFIRRETRGIGAGGRVEYSKSEERDGISTVSTLEKSNNYASGDKTTGSDDPASARPASRNALSAPAVRSDRSSRSESSHAGQDAGAGFAARAARRAELEALEQETEKFFV